MLQNNVTNEMLHESVITCNYLTGYWADMQE